MKNWKKISDQEKLRARVFRYRQVGYENKPLDINGQFDVLDCLDWINVVAFNEDKQMILVKQFRFGCESITHEITGGAIDPGEEPLVAAKRELEEETGFISSKWTLIGKVNPNPAFMSNTCYTYLAQDCTDTGKQNLDHDECIDVVLKSQSEVEDMINRGEIDHALVIAGMYFYNKFKNK